MCHAAVQIFHLHIPGLCNVSDVEPARLVFCNTRERVRALASRSRAILLRWSPVHTVMMGVCSGSVRHVPPVASAASASSGTCIAPECGVHVSGGRDVDVVLYASE